MSGAVTGTDTPALPSIEEVASTMRGGTSSDPNVAKSGTPEPAAADAPKEGGNKDLSAEPAKTEAKKEEPKPKDASASRFAALTRKEKELRQAAAETARKEKEFEARERAFQERESRATSTSVKKDPVAYLKAQGLSMQDIISAAYGTYNAPAPDPLDERFRPIAEKHDATALEVQALKEQLQEFQNERAETQQRQQYEEVMTGLKDAAEGDQEKYEFVNAFGDEAIDLARDVMVEYYKQHSRLLDYSEACDIVEKHYEEKVADRLAMTKKIQSRVSTQGAKAPATAPANATKPATKEAKEPNTLSNRHSTGAQANVDIDKLSPEEAIAVLSKKLMYR